MVYTTRESGQLYSESYKLFIEKDGQPVSPFHDIPYIDSNNTEKGKVYNMVVEVPRWTNAKMEINTKELLNPIKQDMKKGNVRFVHNVFPHKGYMWNYGAIPQTWENPAIICPHTNACGDGDPIDVCEIGQKLGRRGEVKRVKVLGSLALIDDGETDWKVIAIDVTDPMAHKLHDIEDVKREMPGIVEQSHDWLKYYKLPAGSKPNKFAFEGEAKNREFTEEVIEETHLQWLGLVTGGVSNPGLSIKTATQLKDCEKEAISKGEVDHHISALPPFTDGVEPESVSHVAHVQRE